MLYLNLSPFISGTLILILTLLFLNIYLQVQKKRLSLFRNIQGLRLDHEKSTLKTELNINESVFEHISREIHDNIGLSLTLAKLSLITIDNSDEFKRNNAVQLSIDLIGKTIDDLHDIFESFNPEAIASIGLATATELELDKIRKSTSHEIVFNKIGAPVFLEPQQELMFFRIAQEALNNILKHSKSDKIEITLKYCDECIELSIADNGIGFNLEELQHKQKIKKFGGLTNMKLRAELMHGTCEIKTSASTGTTIIINIPKP